MNYRGLNLSFLKLAQILTEGDINSNPGLIQNDFRSPRGQSKRIKVFKEHKISVTLVRRLLLMLLVILI